MKPTFGLGFICKGDPVNDIAISSFLGILLTVDGGSGVRGSNLGVMKRFAIGGGWAFAGVCSILLFWKIKIES